MMLIESLQYLAEVLETFAADFNKNLPIPEMKSALIELRQTYKIERKKVKQIHRDLPHGWLLPYLWPIESTLYGRWEYWQECCESIGELPDKGIPQMDFQDLPHPGVRRMLEDCLDAIGDWQGWDSGKVFSYFFDWLLYGFGHDDAPNLPKEPSPGASMKLYQLFDLGALLLWPYDYWGDLLAENKMGKQQGFFPTPHCIVNLITRMTMPMEEDLRLKDFNDPCLGTGRFPLYASNHSLRLTGQDINPMMVKATLVNGYCFAPWLVKPIPWLDERKFKFDGTPEEIAQNKRGAEFYTKCYLHVLAVKILEAKVEVPTKELVKK